MSKQRDVRTSLFDILKCSKSCIDYTFGMSFEQFVSDAKTIHAVQHQLMIIGEATKRIDDEFRNKYPEIPWKKMAGTRDVLIHSYEEANFETIWDIVMIQILEIIPKVEKILNDLEK